MSPDQIFAAYEALVVRALDWARGMGRFAPTESFPDSRWLTRWDGGFELHWIDDEGEEDLALVPIEAFGVADADFARWIVAKRLESDDRSESNAAIFRSMVKKVFDKK